jgi:predicted permease
MFWRRRKASDFSSEIEAHLQNESERLREQGLSAEEARAGARRAFGNVMHAEERFYEARRWMWWDHLRQDVRFGLRTLRKAPGFTAIVVLILALGIGANTAIFSLIDAVMLRSLPVENPSQLMLLRWSARNQPRVHGYMSSGDCPSDLRFRDANPSGCSLSEPMFREIAKSNQFSGVAAFANSGPLSLSGNGQATFINGQLVSGEFFHTLGVKPAAGRVFDASDDKPTAAPVAVLNWGYWQNAFGGSRDVIGRTIELNAVPFTIIGVAERRFTGITPGSDYDVWLPLAAGARTSDPRMWQHREENVSFWWLTVIGRMKPEASVPQVQAAVSGIFRNEMLYGSVPLFDETGMPGPGGPRPQLGAPGANRVVVGGPMIGGPGPIRPPVGGPNDPGMTRRVAPPAGAQSAGENRAAAPPRNGQIQGASGQPETRTLSKADDAPTITMINAQTGLSGRRVEYANPLYVLMAAVGIILLIACSNVAGLMLARSAARQKEMTLRLALGAGRARIVRQLLTESVMLSVAGGVLGVAFASWGAHAIISFVSSNQPRALAFATGVDLRVLAFTAAISVLTGILFGLAPALRGARIDLTPALKEGFGVATAVRGAGRRFGIGNALVVTQVALAIVVLIGAGLLVRTLQNLRSIDVGFDSHNLVIFGINPSLAGYKETQIDSFYRDLQGRLTETPGVRSVSYSMLPLLSGGLTITGFHWPGTPQDRESQADMLEVGPEFFGTMQIPFLAGRNFNSSDYEISSKRPAGVPRPVVVDQAFVAKYLGKENPIGKRFGEEAAAEDRPATPGYEIVGVVRDTKYGELRREVSPKMFAPLSGMPVSFEVRTAGDPQALIPAIRETVAKLDPNLPLRDVTTQSTQIDRLLFQERLVARLSGFFALLALVLACIGLYGLLAYEVTRRTREIGIRVAVGAAKSDVLRLVVKQGLALALVGTVVGIGVALGVTRYLKTMLYDVRANDPVTMIVVSVLLVMIALAACLIPARRATTVDPMVALRHE